MLPPVDILSDLPAAVYICRDVLQARLVLWLVVERGHDHMPSLVPLRVVPIMTHDEPLDAVILGINLCHRPTVSPAQAASRDAGPAPPGALTPTRASVPDHHSS